MAKRLIFYRHAKSDWTSPSGGDLSRPLAERGRHAADRMGQLLSDSGQVPDLALCSPAVRAKQTLERSMAAGRWRCDVQYDDDLYGGGCASVLTVIRAQHDDISSLMLVGHEPTWSEMVSRMIGGGVVEMPTASMARIDVIAGHWKDVDVGCGHLRWLLQPKLFVKG